MLEMYRIVHEAVTPRLSLHMLREDRIFTASYAYPETCIILRFAVDDVMYLFFDLHKLLVTWTAFVFWFTLTFLSRT